MSTVLNIFNQNLPEEVGKIVLMILGVPFSLSARNLFINNLPIELQQYNLLFTIVTCGLLASVLFAIFGFYVPKVIRTRTSILSFLLWLIMSISFAVSAAKYFDKICFGFGTSLAVAMLFFLTLYFHSTDLYSDFDSKPNESLSDAGIELLIKSLLLALMLFCVITVVTLPVISYVNKDISKSYITGTILHTGSFFFWFFVTGIVAVSERK